MTLQLLFAGDGPRDEAAVPPLVHGMLGVEIDAEFEPWKQGVRLQGGGKGLGGYGRKLLYLLRVARDRGADGIVATVDCDKSSPREKLSDLTAARQRDRTAGYHTPAALGEAIPHLEAWLIDDPVAVRGALQLQPATDIRSPTKIKSPKDELNQLHGQSASELFPLELLAAIATSLDPGRCNHQKDTGFEAFAAEVKAELGQLAPG